MMEARRPAEELLAELNRLGVDYVLVGSVASSALGEPRATMDVDLFARLSETLLSKLAAQLGKRFYFDLETARAALRRGGSFNVISMVDVTKFDFFPAGTDDFAASQLARKRFVRVDFLSNLPVPVASAEDTVLAKLRWFDQGGRSSERQWSDILGVLRVQGARIDWPYIEFWAPQLGLADLVDKLPR